MTNKIVRKRFAAMSEQKNRISMVITEQDERDVIHSIQQITERLRGLVSLPPSQRRNKRMGPTEEGRARTIIRTLQQNPTMVPADLDVAGAVADMDALDRIVRIDDELQRVAQLVKDTRAALGMDVMDVVSVGYALSKTFGAKRGLGALVQELGARFGRGRKRKPQPAPESNE
ncbi:hypothetical protein LVB87_15610 [Lysobacter sp. KIS68-7]|uniref:hypothetical protein n=1 Tax=Lysobacter sp. KIS68-7 TaxID=2904252 RepID=UPI001E369A62|nr:hypothetical protein [Lysobacter sp. KIS68-7]UHQ19593.1 hypothetical protein LVB87_15610 [Lysobacter sp. KIS68-7]